MRAILKPRSANAERTDRLNEGVTLIVLLLVLLIVIVVFFTAGYVLARVLI